MTKMFTFALSEDDAGQMLDGLETRAEAWRRTAEYLRTREFTGEPFLCEDCSDPEEADRVATHFERIIESITKQMGDGESKC